MHLQLFVIMKSKCYWVFANVLVESVLFYEITFDRAHHVNVSTLSPQSWKFYFVLIP